MTAMQKVNVSPIVAEFRGASMGLGESITSPVHRINGFSWRWRAARNAKEALGNFYELLLVCDASDEFELWEGWASVEMVTEDATTGSIVTTRGRHHFASWSPTASLYEERVPVGILVTYHISIVPEIDRESFTPRLSAAALAAVPDVTLVVEEAKFPVNKQVLASQSPFFDRLFFGDFAEKSKKEIELKGIESEDFEQLLKMLHGSSTEPFSEESAVRFLSLADMLDLKIIRDRFENFLISTDLIPNDRKIELAGDYRLETLKGLCPR